MHAVELYLVNEGRVGGDGFGTACTVAEFAGDIDAVVAAAAHEEEA